MSRIVLVLVALAALVACGGNASKNTATPPPSSTPPSGTGGPPAPVTTPAIVTLAGGTAAGVNITVGPPGSATPPNAQDLGVAGLTGSASAFNVGATISRNAIQRVVLFGPGLSGSMQVTVRGPNDIHVSNIVAIQSNDPTPTPGISFTASVDANAALGARTVVLQASNGDITTFTGGLEVVP